MYGKLRRPLKRQGRKAQTPLPRGIDGFGHGDGTEPHMITWAELSQSVQIGGDDRGDLGIAADATTVSEQHYELSIRRDLDGPRHSPFGGQIPMREGQHRSST